MNPEAQEYTRARSVHTILSALAALVCFATSAWVWMVISANQHIWPLPAIYLIEVVILAVLPVISILRGITIYAVLSWLAAGAILAFAALAVFSIGSWYLPALLLSIAAAVAASIRRGQKALAAAAWCAGGAVLQVLITLSAITISILRPA